MFLNNEDMFVLSLVRSCFDCGSDVSDAIKLDFIKIVNKLEEQKNKKNKYVSKYVNSRRKEDKTYAQSYNRKNKMLGL